jgi:predicted permease
MLVLPGIAGLALTLLGLSSDARLAMVLMSGMPTAFTSVILAEEYNLDRQLAASSILLSTIMLPLMIPFWLALFG